MKRPDKVVMLGQAFAIEYEGTEGKLLRSRAAGNTRLRDMALTVDSGQKEHQVRDTLLHEMIHAALLLVGMDPDDHFEPQVGALSPILLDALRSNPDVTTYLLDGERDAGTKQESDAAFASGDRRSAIGRGARVA